MTFPRALSHRQCRAHPFALLHCKQSVQQMLADARMVVSVGIVICVVMSFTGWWPTDDNPFCSYTLQACAWLEGRLDLGQDYPWLELAIYDGKYYVSFPPFPSYVLLPFCAIYGQNPPDHWIMLCVTMLGVIYAMKLYRQLRHDTQHAEWLVLFLFLGNGYLSIGIQAWVWHFAQALCFTLSLMSLTYAARGKGGAALTCWACAVGCRPMVIVYLPLLLMLLWKQRSDRRAHLLQWALKHWNWLILPSLLAASYMVLNVLRFGKFYEFGHRYLPEFTRTPTGQFDWSYLPHNLALLFRLPALNQETGLLSYFTFDCQAFYLIAPFWILAASAWLHALLKGREKALCFALPLMILVHLLIVLCHRTLGGWQFGNRYLVDILPYLFFGFLCWAPGDRSFMKLGLPLMCLGISVNLIGLTATYNHWI